MRIYLAGSYSAKTLEEKVKNVQKAMDVGWQLILMGHAPYIPHLTHFFDAYLQSQGVNVPYKKWIEIDLAFLRLCNALFLVDRSPGAIIELNHAQFHGLAIYYDLKQVPDEKRGGGRHRD